LFGGFLLDLLSATATILDSWISFWVLRLKAVLRFGAISSFFRSKRRQPDRLGLPLPKEVFGSAAGIFYFMASPDCLLWFRHPERTKNKEKVLQLLKSTTQL
jgi:hypothetical protein